ncbi:NAD(P)-dependent oxidoreductase [Phenylobacterium sp. LjRoot225]|uniref:NAD-dependent epimerase/dehydratase family protein n=1 Tax=Phenylobacterium sp. LjRoot225 TaxID=3342285 RepID=UPI003ECF46D4
MGERVLLTGASSFTGLWIAEALATAGFEVIAPLLRERGDYDAERLARIARLKSVAQVVHARPFGSEAFLDLVRSRSKIAALAHHAADVTGYRDPGFDAAAAVARNLAGAPEVLQALAGQGARAVLVTGTVFEAGEGGSRDAPLAVTPYGLSKTLTNVAFQHYAAWAGLRFGRFVIPSPYGPLEQQRSFPAYLFRSWFAGETPVVRTPLYLRDHLPAPLLARAYAEHLAALLSDPAAPSVHRPSGWVATQGDFAEKVAAEAGRRLGRACPVAFAEQTEFPEPLRRVNAEPAPREGWDETAFWDDYVGWYAALQAAAGR